MDGKDPERVLTHEQAKRWVNMGTLSCNLCGLRCTNTQGIITHIRRVCKHKMDQGKWDEISKTEGNEAALKKQKTMKDYFHKDGKGRQIEAKGTQYGGHTPAASSAGKDEGGTIDLTSTSSR